MSEMRTLSDELALSSSERAHCAVERGAESVEQPVPPSMSEMTPPSRLPESTPEDLANSKVSPFRLGTQRPGHQPLAPSPMDSPDQ